MKVLKKLTLFSVIETVGILLYIASIAGKLNSQLHFILSESLFSSSITNGLTCWWRFGEKFDAWYQAISVWLIKKIIYIIVRLTHLIPCVFPFGMHRHGSSSVVFLYLNNWVGVSYGCHEEIGHCWSAAGRTGRICNVETWVILSIHQ